MRKTTEQFIVESKKVHKNTYDYSNVRYINNVTAVTILCARHGIFSQTPTVHLRGGGCPKCATAVRQQTNLTRYGKRGKPPSKTSKNKRSLTCLERYGVEQVTISEGFKEKSRKTNLKKYGVPFATQSTVIIERRKQSNRNKYGVDSPKQLHMKNIIHLLNNKQWMEEQYHGHKKTADQIAIELGVERSTILNYLRSHNIEINHFYPQSVKCLKWLESEAKTANIFIQHANNIGEYRIPGTRITVDGYCANTNTIYEFYGDFWHGHPTRYPPDMINQLKNKTMEQLYRDTIQRESRIRQLGYTLNVMWESEFDSRIT